MAKRNLNRRSAAERAILKIQNNQKTLAAEFAQNFQVLKDYNARIINELNQFRTKKFRPEEVFRTDKRTGFLVLRNTADTRRAMDVLVKQSPSTAQYLKSKTVASVYRRFNAKLKAKGINPYRIPKAERRKMIMQEAELKQLILDNVDYIYLDERFNAAVKRDHTENKARLYKKEEEDLRQWIKDIEEGRAVVGKLLEASDPPKR